MFDVDFNRDGSLLVTAVADGTARVWGIASQTEIVELLGHDGRVRSVAFSPHGEYIAAGCEGGIVRYWHLATAKWSSFPNGTPMTWWESTMHRCGNCGTTILFGGAKRDGKRFCNSHCAEAWELSGIAADVEPTVLAEAVLAVRSGPCPKCGGSGPNDIHVSHWVWSAVVMTSFNSYPELCCRRCGNWRRAKAAAGCLLFGWWGVPWGLLFTPVQVGRNVMGCFGSGGKHEPSDAMVESIRRRVATENQPPDDDFELVELHVTRRQIELQQTASVEFEGKRFPIQLSRKIVDGMVIRMPQVLERQRTLCIKVIVE